MTWGVRRIEARHWLLVGGEGPGAALLNRLTIQLGQGEDHDCQALLRQVTRAAR